MRKYLILIFALNSCEYLFAQQNNLCSSHVNYTYDVNGERLTQTLFVQDCGEAQKKRENSQKTKIDSTSATSFSVKVYPNPAQNSLTVDLGQPLSPVESVIYLYDMLGQVVLTQKTNLNLLQLDVSGINPGEYYLNVVQGGDRAGYSVIKSK